MKIEKHPGGWKITIPETNNNSEFCYIFPLVTSGPENIINGLRKIARRAAILAYSMECFFKTLPDDMAEYWRTHDKSQFEIWSEKNRIDWNEHYHRGMDDLEEQADMLLREWHFGHFDKYGWTAF